MNRVLIRLYRVSIRLYGVLLLALAILVLSGTFLAMYGVVGLLPQLGGWSRLTVLCLLLSVPLVLYVFSCANYYLWRRTFMPPCSASCFNITMSGRSSHVAFILPTLQNLFPRAIDLVLTGRRLAAGANWKADTQPLSFLTEAIPIGLVPSLLIAAGVVAVNANPSPDYRPDFIIMFGPVMLGGFLAFCWCPTLLMLLRRLRDRRRPETSLPTLLRFAMVVGAVLSLGLLAFSVVRIVRQILTAKE